MKKIALACLIVVSLVLMLSACGSDNTAKHVVSQTKIVEEAIVSQSESVTPTPAPRLNKSTAAETQETDARVDYDLPSLSSSMVYSTVFSMMQTPERFVGKTVKMQGIFAYYRDDTSGNEYFACIISDATACCSQGLEFRPSEHAKYPEDYPELGSEITVIGEFDTYLENGYIYCTLKNAKLV